MSKRRASRLDLERRMLDEAARDPESHKEFLYSDLEIPFFTITVSSGESCLDSSKNKKGHESLCGIIEDFADLVKDELGPNNKSIMLNKLCHYDKHFFINFKSRNWTMALTSALHYRTFGNPQGYSVIVSSKNFPRKPEEQRKFREIANTIEKSVNRSGLDYNFENRKLSKSEKALHKVKSTRDYLVTSYLDIPVLSAMQPLHDYLGLERLSGAYANTDFVNNPLFYAGIALGVYLESRQVRNDETVPTIPGKLFSGSVGNFYRFTRNLMLGLALYNESYVRYFALFAAALMESGRATKLFTKLR